MPFNMVHNRAFDNVLHKQLILKLQAYGVHGKLLSWLTTVVSYQVAFNVCLALVPTGGQLLVNYPKGSILGLLLFAIYINDIMLFCFQLSFKFAEDAKLHLLISNPTDIQLLQR